MLAVVAGIAGVVDILTGLGGIGIAGGFLSDHGFGETLDGIMTVVGLVLVAIGVLGLATGFGLWRGRNWAWLITRLWASVCIVVGVVGAALPLLGDTLTSPILGAVIGSTGTAIVAAVVGYPAPTRKYVDIGPLPLMSISPRGVKVKRPFSRR